MASAKNLFLLLGLLFAITLLISSQVAASEESVKSKGVEEVKYGAPGNGNGGNHGGRGGGGGYPRRRCPYGCCRKNPRGPGCLRCCRSAHESPDAELEDDVKN